MADATGGWTRAERRAVAVGLVLWIGWIAAAALVGHPHAAEWKAQSVPLTGHVAPTIAATARAVLVLVAGLALAAHLPAWCRRLPWRRLLLVTAGLVVAWGLALALVRGPGMLDRGLASEHEYPAVVEQVDEIGLDRFVATFTDPDVLRRYPIHVEGHPIGAALVFVGLDRIGLGGAGGAVAFLLAVSAVTPPAVLASLRLVAGEGAARRAAPFLVLAPAAIWSVTSADALFAAVGALGVLGVVAAACRPPDRWTFALAATGGVAFGVGVELTYGLVPLVLIPIVVAVRRSRASVLVPAALGGGLVVGAAGLAGFWWLDGLAATRVRYFAGIASVRPRGYWTILGNPAALSLALGPAVVIALILLAGRWRREPGLGLLVVPALAAVAVANLSGLSKAEVERIWLPFVPWLLIACAVLARPVPDAGVPAASSAAPEPSRSGGPFRSLGGALLAGQVVVAVAIESIVRTPW